MFNYLIIMIIESKITDFNVNLLIAIIKRSPNLILSLYGNLMMHFHILQDKIFCQY